MQRVPSVRQPQQGRIPMDILISVDNEPIMRFPSYGEALAAITFYLAHGRPVESLLMQVQDGQPTPGKVQCVEKTA